MPDIHAPSVSRMAFSFDLSDAAPRLAACFNSGGALNSPPTWSLCAWGRIISPPVATRARTVPSADHWRATLSRSFFLSLTCFRHPHDLVTTRAGLFQPSVVGFGECLSQLTQQKGPGRCRALALETAKSVARCDRAAPAEIVIHAGPDNVIGQGNAACEKEPVADQGSREKLRSEIDMEIFELG
jgi:hypothetical protein